MPSNTFPRLFGSTVQYRCPSRHSDTSHQPRQHYTGMQLPGHGNPRLHNNPIQICKWSLPGQVLDTDAPVVTCLAESSAFYNWQLKFISTDLWPNFMYSFLFGACFGQWFWPFWSSISCSWAMSNFQPFEDSKAFLLHKKRCNHSLLKPTIQPGPLDLQPNALPWRMLHIYITMWWAYP